MTSLTLALRYLTIAPIPAGAHVEPTALGRAAAWFPLIGLALGLVVAAGERVFSLIFPSLLDSLLAVTLWKLLTGGLHLDGLADCLDGFVGHDAGDRLRIMRDSRIGAFGAVGLILFLLLEVAAVSELASATRWRAFAAVPAVARAMPPLVAWMFPAATPLGQGAMFRSGLTRTRVVAAVALGGLVAVVALGLAGLLAFVLAAAASVGLARFYTRLLGGVTGDVLGAVIETAELIVLLTVVAWSGAPR
ncbi:MAG TPA: adenosylcobinamide-GDP ribazoletransferase [Candidatus Acidoferrum sp.]|nr:adenosylcobinamide-GDP ribazoletransferase [Candidatus Acidoferrum sp.]